MSEKLDPNATIRAAARTLRSEPDEAMLARIRTGVRGRIAGPPAVADILAAWLRPVSVIVTVVVLGLAVTLTLQPDLVSPPLLPATAESILVGEVLDGLE